MILAVTHRADEHARPVLDALVRQGAEVAVLDLAQLPARGRLALAYGDPGERTIHLDGAAPIDMARVRALWWRRPQTPEPPRGLPRRRADFAVRQTLDAMTGLLGALEPGALLVNHPWRDDAAAQKTLQLAAAERAGLTVPPTLVTNDPEATRRFLAARARAGAIHKQVHATPEDWRRTRRVGPRGAAGLRDLRHAPRILQQRIPGVDVRVTIVGDELFAADIDARRSRSPDDFRGFERQCRFGACRVPDREQAGLRRLMDDLGLAFAAIDFRRDGDGRWWFLDLNPAGQWRFVERRTAQPITAALAALLARGRVRRRGASRLASPG
ncbi:MAG TPA: alpha-L-glutamate ligase [Anaeromyxobacter sp.]|nr:alpha-L-glutamate ligase [Anaeromyxobacter sp.]